MEERVAVVPGGAFGKCGEGHVRCSYATSMPQLTSALEKIGRFVERVKAEPGNSRNVHAPEPVTIIAENHHV